MKFAIIVFPGSNCDHDAWYATTVNAGQQAEFLWHDSERVGDVGNVVFPCGHVVEPDGDGLRLYYGAADHYIALATTKISSLLNWLDTHGRSYVVRRQGPEGQETYLNHEQRM